jgi:hypothetical protein
MTTYADDFVQAGQEETAEKILVKLLDDKGIELKTEIRDPRALAQLSTLARWLELEKMSQSAKIIDDFVDYFLRYMVSKDRQSRKEIVKALSDRLKRENSPQGHFFGRNQALEDELK